MKRKAFTLIELLVVIAVIALLMAIIMPGLRKAKEYARKVICQSNMRQIGLAIGSYESQFLYNFRVYSDMVKGWFWENGTADMPYEAFMAGPVNQRAQALYQFYLMENDILPDYKVFFCPGVARISYERNYLYNEAHAGNLIERTVGDMRYMMEADPTDVPAFWSTYAWLWKKGPDNPNWVSGTPNNNATNNVLLADVPTHAYAYAMDFPNSDATMLKNVFGSKSDLKAVQTVPHGNVLLSDLSVKNPADKVEEYCQWLWNDDYWAGHVVTIP